MKPQVSVIVPVYQVRPYLERCLNSLLQQSLHEIEIILVDDGSTDGSGAICDHYADVDSRVRVVHQENAGLSAARNTGLDLAQAPYIMFVDSDDWVEPDFCRIPWNLAKEAQVELVFFSRDLSKKGRHISDWRPWQKCGFLQEEEALIFIIYKSIAVWDKLYDRKLFDDVRFPAGRYYEDWAVTHRLVHKAGKAFFVDAVLYHYCIREDSITHQDNLRMRRDEIDMKEVQYQDLKVWGFQNLAESLADLMAFKEMLIRGRNKSPFSMEAVNRLQHIHFSLPSIFSCKQKAMLQIFRFSPLLFDLISILCGKRKTGKS